MSRSVWIVEAASMGEAYGIVQALPSGDDVLELIPTAGPTVLVLGREPSIPARRIAFSEAVERAWLGLENPPLRDRLVIFESESVADVFEAAARLEAAGLHPFDLRILRGAKLKAAVLATGAADARDAVQGLRGVFTDLRDPSPALRGFFELKPD